MPSNKPSLLGLTLVLVIGMLIVTLWLEHQRAETYVSINQQLIAALDTTSARLKVKEAELQQQNEALQKLSASGEKAIKTMKEADAAMAYQGSVIKKQRDVINLCMDRLGVTPAQ